MFNLYKIDGLGQQSFNTVIKLPNVSIHPAVYYTVEGVYPLQYPSMFPRHVKFLSLEPAHPQALRQSRFSTADFYLRSQLVKGRGEMDLWNDQIIDHMHATILKYPEAHISRMGEAIKLCLSVLLTTCAINICKHGTKSFGTSGKGIWPSKSSIGRRFRALMLPQFPKCKGYGLRSTEF